VSKEELAARQKAQRERDAQEMLRQVIGLEDTRRIKDAMALCRRLLKDYPDSEAARQARRRYAGLVDEPDSSSKP
jgi:TolA-binding protein